MARGAQATASLLGWLLLRTSWKIQGEHIRRRCGYISPLAAGLAKRSRERNRAIIETLQEKLFCLFNDLWIQVVLSTGGILRADAFEVTAYHFPLFVELRQKLHDHRWLARVDDVHADAVALLVLDFDKVPLRHGETVS